MLRESTLPARRSLCEARLDVNTHGLTLNDGSPTINAEGQAFAVGGTYSLSKRTRLYAGFLDGEVENGAGTVTTDRRLFALGVRHDF